MRYLVLKHEYENKSVEADNAPDAIRQKSSVEPGQEYVVIDLETNKAEWYRGAYNGRLADRQSKDGIKFV